MAKIKAFKGVRPAADKIKDVASPPYDVLNSEEAREQVKGKPYSFLHVVKPEVDLPLETDHYDESVYQKGRENLYKFIKDGVLIQDKKPCFYLYRLIMGDIDEIGLVAGASIEDYENDIIKKHEHTRAVKEADRIKHVDTLNANTGPVFLTYKAREDMNNLVAELIKNDPTYNIETDDGIKHIFWKIASDEVIEKITKIFADIDFLYVADGHHRSASGTKVGQQRRAANPNHTGEEEYNYFLSVIFPHDQLYIMDYNRVVKDLNELSSEDFLAKVEEKFEIEKIGDEEYKPSELHTFGMYLDGNWYKLTAKEGTFPAGDPVKSLDVSILQENLLHPILAIGDPRKDERIDFVGGIRGLGELSRRVDAGEAVAFAMFPTSIEQLMAIADAGEVMPPKSTWFEPKLRSGIIVHLLD
ncbi:MAG: DUF1015 family protein [Candidatus Cloacimonetes bacterium]|nr:DUF1015 family protein [Candidatus Cloacimonadota bacterium]MCF7813933.1 DUF1015 family protein [Candidatus Cloacimonadota bacterium]MCF7868027.1 DUF1015 family protein [Candidatus Cloacimonadota bacterium]MCF7883947.1 DUF1015 family protein [Candidatus Cloacimonadota bacterium]